MGQLTHDTAECLKTQFTVNGFMIAGLCFPLNLNNFWFHIYICMYEEFGRGIGLCVYFIFFVCGLFGLF